MREMRHDKENIAPSPVIPASAICSSSQKAIAKSNARAKEFKRLYRNERRKNQQSTVKDAKRVTMIRELKASLANALISAANSIRLVAQVREDDGAWSSHLTLEVSEHREQNDLLRKRARALKAQCNRHPAILKRAIRKARLCPCIVKLTRRGAYTPEARALTQIIVKAGCSQGQVGGVIQRIGKVLGIMIKNPMSRRTVSRAILEGGIAAKMQLGYEMSRTKSLTISADSTSHRKINYKARHIALQTPDYSKTSFAGWKGNLEDIRKSFESCPLRQRLGGKGFTIRLFASLLKEMSGDHANNEKLVGKLFEALKKEEVLTGLGEDALMELEQADLVDYLVSWNNKKIAEAGGIEAWNALSPQEQAKRDAAIAKELQISLGMKEYESLPCDKKRIINLFIWAGCCMHKDQNCFEAGNAAMMAYWGTSGHTSPVILANKHNTMLLCQILDPSKPDRPLSEAELTAMQASTCGGAKTTAIAGAILNNKDDKKGQGDTHVNHLTELLGKAIKRFPDTNNTRFGSIGLAGEFLVIHLQPTRTFIEGIKNRKKKPAWTNIELNLYNALHDIPTLSELAILVLYSQSVTRPYMCFVRGPGTEQTNLLDLGPFHRHVQFFIKTIIDDPDLILGSSATYTTATLDVIEWECPDAIAAVRALQLTLPHIRPLLVAFFAGSLTAWGRFSAEFAPGGSIDTATPQERQLAWMPSTNDANEGALGARRVYFRNKPRTSAHQYNALATYNRNETQDFMDALLVDEDHAHLRREARALDASHLEASRRKAQVDFDLRVEEMVRRKDAEKKRKAAEIFDRTSKVILVTTKAQITEKGMTVPLLDAQLDKLRQIGELEIPASKTARGKKADKQDLLKASFQRYTARVAAGLNQVANLSSEPQDSEVITSNWHDDEDEEFDNVEE
ncbi:hypothetical protein B0H34DRAFT_802746 [Crassisporium funariophilum]|nr:hypothetical protein B0H34DRAFT_802746 [Crassisporium funariophilum]